jgi:lactate permease
MEWVQVYNPLGSVLLSTLSAALPIGLLLVTLALFQWPASRAAFAGLVGALVVAVGIYGMPARSAAAAALYGAAYGLFPIGWIVLNAVFLYNLAVQSGTFATIKSSVAHLSGDRRVQALLIGFSFGAFIEGAAGFGTPVAISAALMMGLGFTPLYAAGLALLANTAPVAFGAIGTPILTLAAVTGISPDLLSAMAGRQLPFVSLIVPAWLVVTMSGWHGLAGAWPAVLVSGASFAIVQFIWSNTVGPELVDIIAGLTSLFSLGAFCTWWKPAETWEFPDERGAGGRAAAAQRRPGIAGAGNGAMSRPPAAAAGAVSGTDLGRGVVLHAWMPWIFLSLFVMAWGYGPFKALLTAGPSGAARYVASGKVGPPSAVLSPIVDVPALDRLVFREYPVEPKPVDRARLTEPAYRASHGEAANFVFNWLGATGTAILFAALLSAVFLRMSPGTLARVARATLRQMAWPLLTIALMLALGMVTHYGGTDATLGLAFTRTGRLYPFFAALLGWLGVALTGSDTSSNVLFGSLQKITAQQLGLNPVLIVTANSTGGVMGKMVAAQSIVVATAASNQQGQEGRLLRFVLWHSLALAAVMGIIVMLQAYVFTWMIPGTK